jgi:hypothetical protein
VTTFSINLVTSFTTRLITEKTSGQSQELAG